MDDKEYIELENDFIVLGIPSATVEVEITAKVWNGGRSHQSFKSDAI